MHSMYVLLFLVPAVNFNRFQIVQSYTLLLKPLILMHSCIDEFFIQSTKHHHAKTINEPHLSKKRQDAIQSHPLHGTCSGQH